MQRGVLIVMEGIDGTGKTTQLRLLAEGLRSAGETVVTSREPTDGKWGRLLRQSAKGPRMSLEDELATFVADRRDHVREVIRPGLDSGSVVLLDRYVHSTLAYQGARGADVPAMERAMEFAPRPDLVLLFDADPRVTRSRIAGCRETGPDSFEGLAYLDRVRQIYLDLAAVDASVILIDASQSVSRVWNAIDVAVANHFQLARVGGESRAGFLPLPIQWRDPLGRPLASEEEAG